MQFLSLSRRRTDAFPPEAFTPELVAREGQRVRELYAGAGIVHADVSKSCCLDECGGHSDDQRSNEFHELVHGGSFLRIEKHCL